MNIHPNFVDSGIIPILLCLSINFCVAQNITDAEKNLYTLKNYEYCLFYDEQASKLEGVDLNSLDCSINLNEEYFSKETKALLIEVLNKKYSDEYIRNIAKKRIFISYKTELKEISKKLTDSTNLIYPKSFNRRISDGYEKEKKELEQLLSSGEPDTIPKFKRQFDDLFNYLKKYKVSNSLIYAVAFVEDRQRAIPLLKELLKDTTHLNTSAIKLSLAKLRLEPYYTNQLLKLQEEVNFITSHKNGDNDYNSDINIFYAYPRAGMLLTKEAILIYSKLLEAKYFNTIDLGDVSENSIPVRTLNNLLNLINNKDFHENFQDSYGYPKHIFTKKDIKWAKEWFELNKDKLEINEKHIPKLYQTL